MMPFPVVLEAPNTQCLFHHVPQLPCRKVPHALLAAPQVSNDVNGLSMPDLVILVPRRRPAARATPFHPIPVSYTHLRAHETSAHL
eukprot:7826474-Alexandrium_andersonii.AAC.1